MSDYSSIDRPYDNTMSRGTDTVESDYVGQKDESYAGQSAPQGSGGSINEMPVKEGSSIDDLWINTFIRSKNWKPRAQGFTIDGETGYAEFSNVFITGGIAATTGSIGGWTIATDEFYSGNVHLNSADEQILLGAATAPLTGVGIFIGKDGANYEFRAGDPAAGYMHWDGSILSLVSPTMTTPIVSSLGSGSMLSIQGWQFTGVFSASDTDTVAWTSGTLSFPDGQSFSIGANNTGNMAALTFIYFDKAASTTELQVTTTAATAVGTNKVLIAVAQNQTDEATFQVYGGTGGNNILGSQIAANTITANEIAANTITAGKLSVSQLSAIAADLGAITAGTIVLPSGGHIRSGQTAYDTGVGFWLGNDSGTPKFSIGDSAADKLLWTGTALAITGDITGSDITGGTITGSTFQTDTSGDYIKIDGTTNEIQMYENSDKVAEIVPQGANNEVGFHMFAYDDTNTEQEVGEIEMIFDTVSGDTEARLFIQNADFGGANGVFLISDASFDPTVNLIRIAAELDADLDPSIDEDTDLGNASFKYDNIYCATIHRTSESSPSDIRLKENIIPVTEGLNEIKQLNPVTFDWKHNGHHSYGFIAQEVQPIIPGLVSEMTNKVEEIEEKVVTRKKRDKNGSLREVSKVRRQKRGNSEGPREKVLVRPDNDPQGDPLLQIEASSLIPILVKAVQELTAKVEALEAKM